VTQQSTGTRFIRDPEKIIDIAFITELEFDCQIFLESWKRFRLGTTQLPAQREDIEAYQTALRRHLNSLWGEVYSMVEAAYRAAVILWRVEGARERRDRLRLPESRELKVEYLGGLRRALEHTETRIPDFVRLSFAADPDRLIAGWHTSNDPNDRRDPRTAFYRSLNLHTYSCGASDKDGEHLCILGELARAVEELNLRLPAERAGQDTVVRLPPDPPAPST
jgi:hypothetical protein